MSKWTPSRNLMLMGAVTLGFGGLSCSGRMSVKELEKSDPSYSQALKKEISKKDVESKEETGSEGYSEKLKKEIQEKDDSGEEEEEDHAEDHDDAAYIESIKRSEEFQEAQEEIDEENDRLGERSYIEAEREIIRQADLEQDQNDRADGDQYRPEVDSAIEAVQQNRSEISLKRPGKIRYGLGLQMAAQVDRSFRSSSGGSGRSFSDVYGKGWAPDGLVQFELFPFYSEWWGGLSAFLGFGIGYFEGPGQFQYVLSNEKTGESFNDPKTRFHMTIGSLVLGGKYHLNVLRLIRPYGSVGYRLVGFRESRTDGRPAIKGRSTAFQGGLGVKILLDWLSRESAWNYYEDISAKHYYLTLEYLRTVPLQGSFKYELSGFFAGFSFEM